MNEAGGFGSVVGGMMLFIIALAIPWPLLIVGGVILVVGILFACMKKKPEQLPITKTNLIEAHIAPPRMAKIGIGNITTSNYVYYISVGDKFSFLVRTHLEAEYSQLQKQYLWPMSRMDTNAAYQLATQFLAAVSMDVKALNRDCDLTIRAFTPEGKNGSHFVPVYWVSWGKDGKPIASVELFEPTKTIRQMHVNKSEYILRKPLEITNLDYLLSQTNAPVETNVPAKP